MYKPHNCAVTEDGFDSVIQTLMEGIGKIRKGQQTVIRPGAPVLLRR